MNIIKNCTVLNALTVDVEGYFQVSAFNNIGSRDDWPGMPLRVEQNTRRLLDLFDEKQVKGSVFLLGWVTERRPELVREIEFPISTWRRLGMNIPIAGGGYFRMFPYMLGAHGLAQVTRSSSGPFVFYLHCWEVDAQHPRINSNLLSRFRHYNYLHRSYSKLSQLHIAFAICDMHSVLRKSSLL